MNNYQAADFSDRWNWLFRPFGCVMRPEESARRFFPTRREIRFQPEKKTNNDL